MALRCLALFTWFAFVAVASGAFAQDFDPQSSPASKRPARASIAQRALNLNSTTQKVRRNLIAVFGQRIRSSQDESSVICTLKTRSGDVAFEFEEERRRVVVRGSAPLVDQAFRLLMSLDSGRRARGQRVGVVAVGRSDPQKIRQIIELYRQKTGEGEEVPAVNDSSRLRSSSGLALVAYIFQEGEEDKDEAADSEPPVIADEIPAGLEVDVEIDTLPDLDVIIMTGRDADVRRMTQIIQQLEKFSEEAKPEVKVYQLRHASSESIQQIITQIQEPLTRGRQGRFATTPLIKPNAILVVGWGEALASALELIAKLDKPVPPDAQFEIFRLRFATAASLQQSIQNFYAGRAGLAPRVQILSDVRSNTLVVYAAPRDLLEVRRLVKALDTPESKATNVVRVFQVKNSLAADLATTLQAAIVANPNAPSAVLELLTIDAEGQRILKSGMLTNVKITPNVRNNTLVVSGPKESMPLLEALVKQLDSPVAVSKIKVFRVHNGDASALVTILRSLIPEQPTSVTGPQLPNADGEESLAPLRFSVDGRTNSIIATGSEGDLRVIEALILRLDEKEASQRRNEVYRLKNAPALAVAAAINQFLRSERSVQASAPGMVSQFEEIEREVVVVPETNGNSLIISATPRYFDSIKGLIEKIDKQPPQVMIEVLIAEVSLSDAEEFGVELGIQDSILFDRSLLGDLLTTVNTSQVSTADGVVTNTNEIIRAATNTPGFAFNNVPLGNSGSTQSLANSGNVAGQALSSFAVGRVNNELGFGGLVLSASSESVSVLIRALEETRRIEVLSRPQIRTLDNQPAFIQVGQKVPRIVGSTINEIGQQNQVVLEDVGLILGVTPRVSPDGTVVMEIDAEKSSLGPEAEGIPVSVSVDGTVVRSPRIDVTNAQATVSAGSGETIVLGGLITKNKQEINRRVPYLADIPVLGELFRFDSYSDRRTELLIVLTPTIIRNAEDSERVKQVEIARMSWCEADVYDVYGDLGYVPLDSTLMHETETEVIYPDLQPRGTEQPAPRASLGQRRRVGLNPGLRPSAGGTATITSERDKANGYPLQPTPVLPPEPSSELLLDKGDRINVQANSKPIRRNPVMPNVQPALATRRSDSRRASTAEYQETQSVKKRNLFWR